MASFRVNRGSGRFIGAASSCSHPFALIGIGLKDLVAAKLWRFQYSRQFNAVVSFRPSLALAFERSSDRLPGRPSRLGSSLALARRSPAFRILSPIPG
jgi:hypothetical protein